MPQNSLIPNVTEIFLSTSGNILETLGSSQFYPQSNYANLILIHLEDGGANNSTVFANFTPTNESAYTSHWFYMKYEGLTTHVINGEPKEFATYAMRVPNIVLANNNKNNVITNQLTIKQVIGSEFLGSFDDLTDLNTEVPATEALAGSLAVAYVIETEKFYQVVQNVETSVYEWVIVDLISAYTETKQYSIGNIEIQKGYSSDIGVTPITQTTSVYVMQIIDEMRKSLVTLEEMLPDIYVKRDFLEYSEKTILDEEDRFVVDVGIGTRYIKKSNLITPLEDDISDIQGDVSDIQNLFHESDPTTEIIKLKEIYLEHEGSYAQIKYTNSNGNHYKVVDIVYEDGRTSPVNEEFYVDFRNATGTILVEGQVLMTDGTTQGSQAVNGFLFDEASANAYNLLGVVTVPTVAINAKSKVTHLGIVHNVNQTALYNTGVAYAEGQVVWARGGKLSNVAPAKPNLQVRMGAIINKVGPHYDILIIPHILQKVSDSSDVHVTNPQTNDILIKDENGKYINSQRLKLAEDNLEAINLHEEEIDGRLDDLESDVGDLQTDVGNLETNKADTTYVNQEVLGAKTFATSEVTTHNTSEVAHVFIRTLIQDLEREVARLDGRGKSYGEVPYTTAQMQDFDSATRATNIKNAIEAQEWFEGTYTPSEGDLVYDTGVGLGVDYHEWEYNGTAWVDNGAINQPKATNDIFGTIKGNEYLDIVAGLVQVLNADLATDATNLKDAGSENKYTYQNVFDALANRYTKAEVDALLDQLKAIFGWEDSDLGILSDTDTIFVSTLDEYDYVILQLKDTASGYGYFKTQIFKPSDLSNGDLIQIFMPIASEDVVINFNKGATNYTFNVLDDVTSATLKVLGIKMAMAYAENTIYDNTDSDLTATNVQEAIDEVKGITDDIIDGTIKVTYDEDYTVDEKIAENEGRIDVLEPIVTQQGVAIRNNEHRVDVVEETLRKSVAGDVTAVQNGEEVIHLPKDVANGQVRPQVDGMTLQATNLVSNDAVANLGTRTFTTVVGVKYYVNDRTTSSIITGDGNDYTLTNNTGASAVMLAYNQDTLKANKQYSPLFNTTLDLMSDANIKTQMDAWVTSGELPNDSIQSVSGNKRYKAVGKNLFDKGSYATSYAYKIRVKSGQQYTWSASTAYKTYDKDLVEIASATASTHTMASNGVYIAFSGVANVDTFQLETGSTATAYIPFTSSEMYLQANRNLFGYDTRDKLVIRNGKAYGQYLYDSSGTILGSPIETEIEASGQILGGERYTVYVDSNVIAPQAVIYTDKVQIGNVTYPISALDSIVKLNANGSQTALSVASATVAGDGLSFTHTGLTAGDIVIFTYRYADVNSVVGNSALTYFDSRYIVTDTVTGTVYKWNVTSANGVASITLTAI